MADHDIQKSKQLLKRLEEEMNFLRSVSDKFVSGQFRFFQYKNDLDCY